MPVIIGQKKKAASEDACGLWFSNQDENLDEFRLTDLQPGGVDDDLVVIILLLDGSAITRNDGDAPCFFRQGFDDLVKPSSFFACDSLLEGDGREPEEFTRLDVSQLSLLFGFA